MIQPADVQDLLGRWWFVYDEALVEEWPALFTHDVHFLCRTDTGATDYEEFVRADVQGREAMLAWQTQHRLGSPHPLRHGAANVHLTSSTEGEATFRSYIWVTHIVGGFPAQLSTAIVQGAVRVEEGALRICRLEVVLDTRDSIALADRQAG
ncbi:MAG: nuclear transport factor 2 family protein [Acidimicrobiales bacterium]|jgi:hypothetical protein|nr:nuclear transport factor 2 family protein [Acidimicrobiales bacterium]